VRVGAAIPHLVHSGSVKTRQRNIRRHRIRLATDDR
jgi:hypothetical protein